MYRMYVFIHLNIYLYMFVVYSLSSWGVAHSRSCLANIFSRYCTLPETYYTKVSLQQKVSLINSASIRLFFLLYTRIHLAKKCFAKKFKKRNKQYRIEYKSICVHIHTYFTGACMYINLKNNKNNKYI